MVSEKKVFLENKKYCDHNKEKTKLKEELSLVTAERDKLCIENKRLQKEVEALRNECIDKSYEHGLFLEDEVLKKIENENCRLKELVDEVYSNVANVWFDIVKDKIKKEQN